MAAGDALAQVDLNVGTPVPAPQPALSAVEINVGVPLIDRLSALAYIDAEVVVTPPRAYLRTAGSTRAVQMKQPDGSWWPVRTST